MRNTQISTQNKNSQEWKANISVNIPVKLASKFSMHFYRQKLFDKSFKGLTKILKEKNLIYAKTKNVFTSNLLELRFLKSF